MKYTTGIYKIENLINHKVYIGQSTNIGRRWTEHKYHSVDSKYEDYDYPLYRAFRKYGLDNFSFDILEECDKCILNEREVYWIEQYNSLNDGYNQVEGGAAPPTNRKLTDAQADEIRDKLKTTYLSQEEIAAQYNISRHVVSDINLGQAYTDSKVDYPIRAIEKRYCPDCGGKISRGAERCMQCAAALKRTDKPITRIELKERIRKTPFTQIGKEFSVSDNTIRKWCKGYNLPSTKKEIASYTDEQWELL